MEVLKTIGREIPASQVHESIRRVFKHAGKKRLEGQTLSITGFNGVFSSYFFEVTFNVSVLGGRTTVIASGKQFSSGGLWVSGALAIFTILWIPIFVWQLIVASRAVERVEAELQKGLDQVAEQLR